LDISLGEIKAGNYTIHLYIAKRHRLACQRDTGEERQSR